MRYARRTVLFLRSLALVATSRVFLDRRGTTATLDRLTATNSTTRAVDPMEALAAVRRAGRMLGALCLPQAVALTALLQRCGYQPVLVLGCRREASSRWTAHAWVKLDALVLEPVVALKHDALAHLREANGWVPSPIGTSEMKD